MRGHNRKEDRETEKDKDSQEKDGPRVLSPDFSGRSALTVGVGINLELLSFLPSFF